jgi:hypothetical protein
MKVSVAVAEPPAGTGIVVEPVGPPHPWKLAAREDDSVRVTDPLKPPELLTVITDGQQVYWFILMEFGLAERLKSGQFTTLTTTLGV